MLAQILLTFVVVLVGVNLVPTVFNTVFTAKYTFNGTTNNPTNVTGVNATLLDLVPLFYVLGVLLTTIQSSILILNKMGF